MFAVLKVITTPRRNIISRVFRRLKPKKPLIEDKDFGQIKYRLITVEESPKNKELNWARIAKAAGEYSDKMLIPKSYNLPFNSPVSRFCDYSYMDSVKNSTVLHLIKKSQIQPSKLTVCLAGFTKEMEGLVYLLVPYVFSVKIICEDIQLCERIAEDLMDKYGFSLIYSTDSSIASQSNICIVSRSMGNIKSIEENTVVFSLDCYDISCKGIVMDNYFPRIPPEILRLVPDGISPVSFASAVYSLCSVRELGLIPAAYALSNNKVVPEYELISMITRTIPEVAEPEEITE